MFANAVAAAPEPLTTSRHSQKRGLTSRTIVPNSSDHEDDRDTIAVEHPPNFRRVLKEVAIPSMSARKASTRGRPSTLKAQPEQDSSNGSPSVENSDYDTPGTSLSTTPATSIRRGKTPVAARKSGLSKAVTASLSRSSSMKRSRTSVLDSDDDSNMIDADAELARQLQQEDDNFVHPNKRMKLQSDDELDLSEEDEYFTPRTTKAKAYRGKGKGKAKIEDVSDDDDKLSLETLSTRAYSGKGKGTAQVESGKRSRSARASAKKAVFREEDFLDAGESEGEDFQPEDVESALSELDDTPMASESEEEPLMAASSRLKKTAALKRLTKPKRGKKSKTAAEQRDTENRRARFAHISDKWERKRAMNRERAEQQHSKLLTMWDDLAKIPILETEKSEQPPSISRRLKPFQLEGLSWMIRQEKTHYRGGLLGDEMGMGKTIQAVSLIMSDYPAKEPTLVCVPPVALMQWSNEIREYTDNKLKVLVYHGTNAKCKKMSVKELRSYDVIMVSYNSLESLHRKETKGWSRGEDIIKEASPLHAINYHRLILDEAHSIKSRNTGVAKACFALRGDFKWCLSGTPVQNRIGEFFSLLRFLEVRPFADYFCRSCKCVQVSRGKS